jgi:hypothetical protein
MTIDSAITTLTASSTDADFDAITATSYGGITEANLLSKAATASIASTYTFTGSSDLVLQDNVQLQLGTTGATGDAQLYSDGTDIFLQLTAANGVSFTIKGGADGLDRMLECINDAAVSIYHNGTSMIVTQSNVTNTSGATIRTNNVSGVTRDIGFNILGKEEDNPASVAFDSEHVGGVIFADDNTGFTVTVEASGGSNFKIGGLTTIINGNTSAAITVADNSTALYYLDGTTRTDVGATCTVAAGGVANIWREAAAVYYIWGTGITI